MTLRELQVKLGIILKNSWLTWGFVPGSVFFCFLPGQALCLPDWRRRQRGDGSYPGRRFEEE